MKIIRYLPLILMIFTNVCFAYFKDSQVKQLFPSNSRLFYQLNNNWDLITPLDTYSKLNIPHLTNSKSRLVYQREFVIDKNTIDKFNWSLIFLGVASEIEVYVNEQFVGKFSSNYLPFNVELPRKILTRNNILKLILTPDANIVNYFQNDIFAPSQLRGIPRDIFLEARPQIFVSNLTYKSSINKEMNNSTLTVIVEIQSKDLDNLFRTSVSDTNISKVTQSKQFAYQIQLREKDSKAVIAQTDYVSFAIDPYREITKSNKISVSNFKTWSLESPSLYELVCRIYSGGSVIDEYISNFAFRNFEIIKNAESPYFKLNGKRFAFKAVGYIENFIQQGKINLPSKFDEDFRQLKVLGANAIVFKYFYPNKYLLDLCDRYGMLVFIDLPLYNLPITILSSENNLAYYINQIKNSIAIYSSNPSVVGFGLGKGLEDTQISYQIFLNKIGKLIKDNTDKFIYKTVYAENKNNYNDYIDFVFFQSFETREKFDRTNELFKSMKLKFGSIPVILSYGVAIQNNNHEGYSNPFSVEYQSHIAHNLYQLSIVNNGNGSLINNFNDYYSHYPILQTQYIDEKVVTNGLIDIHNKNKTSFAFVKALFNEENPPLLDIGNFTNTVYTFIILSLLLIVIFLALYSRFRRFQEYFIRALLRPFNFYADIRDQRILSPSLTYSLVAIIAISFGLFFESLSYYFLTSERFQFITTILIPDILLQSLFYKIICIPIAGIAVFALLFLLVIYLVAIIIRFFAYLTHRRVTYFDVMNITIWGSLPLVFLLPFDLVLFKLLQIDSIIFNIIILFSVLIFILSIFRILKATSVVFDIKFQQVYLVGIGIIAIIFFGIYLLYQSQSDFSTMVSYFVSVLS